MSKSVGLSFFWRMLHPATISIDLLLCIYFCSKGSDCCVLVAVCREMIKIMEITFGYGEASREYILVKQSYFL